jgi:PAS domain S-box-containing protein
MQLLMLKIAISPLMAGRGAIVAINTNQQIIYWSHEAESLFGISPDQALGCALALFCKADWLCSLEAQDELAYTGHWCGEQLVYPRGKRARSVQVSVSLLVDRGGHLVGWQVTFEDVTSPVEAVLEMQRRN